MVASLIFVIFVIFMGASSPRKIAPATHEFAFYSRISVDLRNRILNSHIDAESEEFFISDIESVDGNDHYGLVNDHILAEADESDKPSTTNAPRSSRMLGLGEIDLSEFDWGNEADAPARRWKKSRIENELTKTIEKNGAAIVHIPNGHALVFHKNDAPIEIEASTLAYVSVLNQELTKEKISHVLKGFAVWAVPVIAVYALGWAIGWVYRGFRKR